MNVKKEVLARVKNKLENEQRDLKIKAERNAYTMNKLAEENAITKREIAKIGELIKSLGNG